MKERLQPDTGRMQNMKYRGVTGKKAGKMTEKMTEKKAEKGIKTWTERWRMVYGEKNNTMYSRYQPNERTWRLFFERR